MFSVFWQIAMFAASEWKREETCFRSPIRLNEILLSHFLCWMMLSNLLMAERRRSATVKRCDTDFRAHICWRRFKGEEISSKRDVKLLHLWGSVKVASASIGTTRLFAAAIASYAIKRLPNLIRCTTQHANYWPTVNRAFAILLIRLVWTSEPSLLQKQ